MSLSLTGESQMARREHGFCGYGGVGLAPRRGFGGHIGNGLGFGRHGGAMGFPGVVPGRGIPVQGVFGGPHPCAMGPGPRNHHLRRGGIFGNRYVGTQGYGLPTGGVYNGNCPNANPGQLCLECGLIHYNSIESESRNKKSCCATKDIIVRGKTYSIRRSFLSDNTKFENELCKYVDKKKESELPEDVVQLLIDYINDDEYECNKLLDEVTLNILASQVGVKSIVEISLNNLKNWTLPVMEECFVQVTITVLFSKKVDAGLKQWLGSFLVERAVLQDLWVFFTRESPEVAARLEIMFTELSMDVTGFGLGYRIL